MTRYHCPFMRDVEADSADAAAAVFAARTARRRWGTAGTSGPVWRTAEPDHYQAEVRGLKSRNVATVTLWVTERLPL